MAWERLRTDFTDRTYDGERKFNLVKNADGTYYIYDVTVYINEENSFFSALEANRIDAAVNAIMAALENGTDLYEDFTEFFDNQKTLFEEKSNADLYDYEVYLDGLRATANKDIAKLKSDYTAEMQEFETQQQTLFTQWFNLIKGQLSEDAAGHLQNEIEDLFTHIKNLSVKIRISNTVGEVVTITLTNTTTGSVYTITDYSTPLYLTEAGDYVLTCANEDYQLSPATMHIDHNDVMTTKVIKLVDGNGLAFVGGFVGSYVNH